VGQQADETHLFIHAPEQAESLLAESGQDLIFSGLKQSANLLDILPVRKHEQTVSRLDLSRSTRDDKVLPTADKNNQSGHR
jgi:hypothetical protein